MTEYNRVAAELKTDGMWLMFFAGMFVGIAIDTALMVVIFR